MVPSPKDEYKLIISWKNGDEKSFDALFRLHFSRLQQFALRHTNDAGISEELAMDTLFKVWQQKDTLHQDAISLAPLLFRILRVSLVDQYRKRKLQVGSLEELSAEPQDIAGADDRLLTQQLRNLYQEGLDRLSPKQKLVFEMRNERELTYREIAGELELSVKTVDRHLSDSVNSIRKYVSKFLAIGTVSMICYFFL